MVLEHLPLADVMASAVARRQFPLVEREDLILVAREALVSSAPRFSADEPRETYLRHCITGALQHHLRDRMRLVRIPHRCMSRASAHWLKSASMQTLMES